MLPFFGTSIKDFILQCPFTRKKFSLPPKQCCPKQKPPVVVSTKQHFINGDGKIVEKLKLPMH